MNYLTLLIFLLSAIASNSLAPVNTKYGPVFGTRLRKYKTSVIGYFGIPFAKPPVGKLRFMPPEPLKENAFKYGFKANKVARTCFFKPRYTGFIGFDYWHPKFLKYSEDCLQLNMWVPKKPDGSVLVYIFGRAYHSGSPSLEFYNGAVIAAKKNIIVVNINYRFDVLGFSFLGNGSVITGNVGLKDQEMALRWIYKNIEYFGGNRKMITVFGEGTGAVSAIAHLYSEESSRYIKRVIALSGTIKNTWAYQRNSIVNDNFMKLAKDLQCYGDERKILRCLQSVNVKDLVSAADKITHPEQSPLIHSFTIVESDNIFFKGNVTYKMLKKDMKKTFDILLGKTSKEATYFMPQYLDSDIYGCNLDPRKPINSECNSCNMNYTNFKHAVELLTYEYLLDDEDASIIEKTYSKYGSSEYREKTIRLISDFTFDCDIVQFAKYISSFVRGNKYFFEYNIRSSSNPWPKWMGAMHAYELEYFFGVPFRHHLRYNYKTFEKERKFSQVLIDIIGSFVQTGKTCPKWKQFDEKKIRALLIGEKFYKKNSISYVDEFTKTCKVHDKILKKYSSWGTKFNNAKLRRHM